MRKNVVTVALALFTLAVVFGPHDSHAQVGFGPEARAGFYSQNDDFFLGAGLRIGVPFLTFVPNAEYVFVNNGSYYTLNLDGQINVLSLAVTSLWVGGGLARVHAKPEGSDSKTSSGANLYAGFGMNAIVLKPYVQAKYIVNGDDQFVLSVGLRF